MVCKTSPSKEYCKITGLARGSNEQFKMMRRMDADEPLADVTGDRQAAKQPRERIIWANADHLRDIMRSQDPVASPGLIHATFS